MRIIWLFHLSRWIVYIFSRLYFRIEFEGTENIPKDGPMLLAPNHVSFMDPLWVSLPVTRPMRYMAWDQLVKKPLVGPLMKAYGSFPVNLERADRVALRKAGNQLKRGGGLVIFPEGARSRDGKLAKFKSGVIRLALESDVPIVPATVIGGYRAYSVHHWLPRPYKVRIVYHPPIRLGAAPEQEVSRQYLREATAQLRAVVASALTEEEKALALAEEGTRPEKIFPAHP